MLGWVDAIRTSRHHDDLTGRTRQTPLGSRPACPSGVSVTIKSVCCGGQDSAGPKARPLRFLTRADLGYEYELACRIALAEWRHLRRRSTRQWWRHAAVERVLHEIGLRYLDELEQSDRSFFDEYG